PLKKSRRLRALAVEPEVRDRIGACAGRADREPGDGAAVFAEVCPDLQFGQQAAAQLPWFHVVTLLTKVPDASERAWYAARAAEQAWSRATLEAHIKSGLHLRQGAALTNFERH